MTYETTFSWDNYEFCSRENKTDEICWKNLSEIDNQMNDISDLNFMGSCILMQNKTCNIFKKVRSYDGSCNNLLFPLKMGVANTPFRRILSPDYSDGKI